MKQAKRWLAFLLATMMFLLSTACGGQELTDKMDEEKEVFDANVVLSQLEVTEYTHYAEGDFLSSEENEVYLIIKNNSKFNINVQCELTTYDNSGEIVEIKYGECISVGGDTEDVCVFENLRKYASYKYELIPQEERDYDCVSKELSYEFTKTENMVYTTITNNSKTAAQVYVHMFCFKNGQMAYYTRLAGEYGNNHVASGLKITCDANVWFDTNYDDYKLIVKGRESRN